MCGIAGSLGGAASVDRAAMLSRLAHRGPDDQGEWVDEAAGVWLGHRRLAVLDLSDAGSQPMESASGRFIVTYNGELYNHLELRRRLVAEGVRLRSTCDTEVLLEAIERWGLLAALKAANGMFAFGLWDRHSRSLTLVRDRIGEKPLYYATAGTQLAFASELQALRPLPWIDTQIDQQALTAYLRYLAVPAPSTIIRGVRKLLPGELIKFAGGTLERHRWWDLAEVVRSPRQDRPGGLAEAANELEGLLRDSVALRTTADVPVGAFLSGGVDSSAIVALLQSVSPKPVPTFTIGFDEKSHDESPYARAVAEHLGTDHHEERFTAQDLLLHVPEMPRLHDEPFADVSSLPTALISLVARQHVTVALSGDGGDELFGGYPRYFWADRIAAARRRLGSFAPYTGRVLGAFPETVANGPIHRLTRGRFTGAQGLGARIRRFGNYLGTPPEDVYARVVSAWPEPGRLTGASGPPEGGPRVGRFPHLPWAEQMMAVDQDAYLPDDILTKMDRCSMAVGLEARVPLLDPRIIQFAWSLPSHFKLAPKGDLGKLVLRQVLQRYVPPSLVERPKTGFGVPMATWLRGPLRSWAEDLLGPDSLKAADLHPTPVRQAWSSHLSGADHQQQIWTVLMYVAWLERWRTSAAEAPGSMLR